MKHLLTTLPELGQTVARLRKEKGLTQRDLGQMVGVGQSTLARFETGQVSEFGSRKLLRLLEALGYGVVVDSAPSGFTLDDALAQRQSESAQKN